MERKRVEYEKDIRRLKDLKRGLSEIEGMLFVLYQLKDEIEEDHK